MVTPTEVTVEATFWLFKTSTRLRHWTNQESTTTHRACSNKVTPPLWQDRSIPQLVQCTQHTSNTVAPGLLNEREPKLETECMPDSQHAAHHCGAHNCSVYKLQNSGSLALQQLKHFCSCTQYQVLTQEARCSLPSPHLGPEQS